MYIHTADDQFLVISSDEMARGQQKLQSQQKNIKKQQELKKGQGPSQKAAAQKALIYSCSVCKAQMPDPKTYREHFENKHPKSPLPAELEESTSAAA